MHGRTAPAILLVAAAGPCLSAPPALAQQDPPGDGVAEEITAHIVRPEQVEPTDERLAQLRLPPGFRIEKFAEGLGGPRMLAFGPDGSLFVTRPKHGDVLRILDDDGDGRADHVERAVTERPGVHGITFHQGRCYLATVKEILECDVQPDGSLSTPRAVVDDLPDGGQHPNRTIAFGPDGMLYVSVGSTCNDCEEPNPEHATLLRLRPGTWEREVFAHGLRNTIGFGWHPRTGELWGMDHGIDWLGDDVNEEELNRITRGAHYGWPHIYNNGRHNPVRPPSGTTYERFAAMTEPPVLTYTAHAAPIQMAFSTGDAFPPEYRGDAFVVMRGSWNRSPPSGYEVVRIDFDGGEPVSIEPFVTGFLTDDGAAHFGRLAGVAAGPDGSLFIGDDTCGVIYRIRHEGD